MNLIAGPPQEQRNFKRPISACHYRQRAAITTLFLGLQIGRVLRVGFTPDFVCDR